MEDKSELSQNSAFDITQGQIQGQREEAVQSKITFVVNKKLRCCLPTIAWLVIDIVAAACMQVMQLSLPLESPCLHNI